LGAAPDNIIETGGALILGGGVAGLFTALKLAPMPSKVTTPQQSINTRRRSAQATAGKDISKIPSRPEQVCANPP